MMWFTSRLQNLGIDTAIFEDCLDVKECKVSITSFCLTQLWEAIDGERPSRPGSLFTSTNFVPKAQRALLDAPMTLPHKINEIPAFKSLYESGASHSTVYSLTCTFASTCSVISPIPDIRDAECITASVHLLTLKNRACTVDCLLVLQIMSSRYYFLDGCLCNALFHIVLLARTGTIIYCPAYMLNALSA